MWPHKYYLFGGGGVPNRDNSSQSLLLGLSNSGGAVFLRDTTKMTVDLVGWGSAVAGNYEGTACPKPAQGVSLERKAKSTSDATSMGAGGADEFAGNGYDTDNNANDFVQRTTPQPQSSASPAEPSTYANGDGTGVATISPKTMNASETSSIMVTLVGDTVHVLNSVIVVVPPGWSWSRDAGSVHLNQSQSWAPLTVISDTIFAGSVHVTNVDTLELTITNVTAPAVGGNGIFQMKTAVGGGSPMPIANPPSVEVLKLVPMIDIHINDSQGVPASPYQTGTVVTVSGIITADLNATRTDLYLQDATAGINIFSYSRSYNYQVGDSVTFTGTIQQYRGTTEIMPDSAKTVFHSHGNPVPEPMLLTASDVNLAFNADNYTEPNEGRLIRINGITYNATNQTVSDITGTTGGFIPNTLNIPTGTFDLIGILKQYKPGTPAPPAPYTADYEIVARTQDDIITHSGPVFVETPTEENIQSNSVTIYFKTETRSNAVVRYGTTASYTDSVVVSADTVHAIVLSGLWPATVYHYQAVASDSTGTNRTGDAIFSTASQTGTTGIINVYFSKSVDTTVARGENAQTVDISSKFISRINAAQHSIDVALYSLSGTVGSNIATALINAKNRGVKVRMIVEDDNSNTAPMSTMKSSGIPFITDSFDPLNAGSGLMHNKFAIFDLCDTSSFTDDWVWSGSWNATDPGNNSDAQNAVEIQDKALANAYTMEFNEMWGSSTDTANSSQSRFGIRKTDNTPHKFNINGTPVELYFSPSDQTTLHIYQRLNEATSSINICMLTFTRSDLAQALVAKKAAGEKVRVILDNNTDSGNQFNFLQNGSVDIHLKGSALGTGLLHHKYAIVDAENSSADAAVITGSHNWSNSAETSNNENTLMIHSKRVANLYLQEFKARYLEAGGSDNIAVGVKQAGNDLPKTFALSQNYPNPFNPTTVISYQLPANSYVTLKVYDVLGRVVATLVNERENAGSHSVTFDASRLPSGVYFYRITAGSYTNVKKMLLLK